MIRRSAGAIAGNAIYVDDVSDMRRQEDRRFKERGTMLDQLRAGDTVAVASPGRLGIGRDDVRRTLHLINRLKCSVLDAGSGRRITWTDAVANGVSFLDSATIEHQAYNLRHARAQRQALGIIIPRTEPKKFKVADDAALRAWRDTIRYNEDEAAAIIGVSKRTCYKRLGGRLDTGEPPMKRRRRK